MGDGGLQRRHARRPDPLRHSNQLPRAERNHSLGTAAPTPARPFPLTRVYPRQVASGGAGGASFFFVRLPPPAAACVRSPRPAAPCVRAPRPPPARGPPLGGARRGLLRVPRFSRGRPF